VMASLSLRNNMSSRPSPLKSPVAAIFQAVGAPVAALEQLFLPPSHSASHARPVTAKGWLLQHRGCRKPIKAACGFSDCLLPDGSPADRRHIERAATSYRADWLAFVRLQRTLACRSIPSLPSRADERKAAMLVPTDVKRAAPTEEGAALFNGPVLSCRSCRCC